VIDIVRQTLLKNSCGKKNRARHFLRQLWKNAPQGGTMIDIFEKSCEKKLPQGDNYNRQFANSYLKVDTMVDIFFKIAVRT
jgi:hypothetical protein